MRQPELKTVFGVRWYGPAETVTGHVWWYTDEDGKRHPLMPVQPRAWSDEEYLFEFAKTVDVKNGP